MDEYGGDRMRITHEEVKHIAKLAKLSLKEEEVENLQKKTVLCETIEAIDVNKIHSYKEWENPYFGFPHSRLYFLLLPRNNNQHLLQETNKGMLPILTMI